MATSVATVFHSAADGEQFTASAWRLGAASKATVTSGWADALKARSGIQPGAGTPLDVVQLVSPAMQVTVKKGTVLQQSTSALGGVYSHSLTSDTALDIATAHASNPRLDVLVATVFDDGTSASNTKIEVLTGTAAASPSLPAALTSPPANTHYFPLAQVRVEAAVTSIVTAKITKPGVVALGLTMGQFTAAPGGTILGQRRLWIGQRTTIDTIAANGTPGNVMSVTLPYADLLPGVYDAHFYGFGRVNGSVGSGYTDLQLYLEVPGGTRPVITSWENGTRWWLTATEPFILESVPTVNQVVAMNAAALSGGQPVDLGHATNFPIVKVVRKSDF